MFSYLQQLLVLGNFHRDEDSLVIERNTGGRPKVIDICASTWRRDVMKCEKRENANWCANVVQKRFHKITS
jgi:hypothetical protein